MKFSASTLRATYDFLRVVAFDNSPLLPDSRFVRLLCRPIKHHGYHDYVRGRHTIWIDSQDTHTVMDMVYIMAHEMLHIIRRDQKASDADTHDELFKQMARTVEQVMGWKKGGGMKTLLLDIETAPNKVYSWGMWDQNIAMNQVMETSYVMCWSAKWLGERKIMFDSVQKSKPAKMLAGIHRLLDTAHAAVHYNGLKFDIPTLNKEFIKAGFHPPAPYKQVDCLKEVRRLFRFEMNKLDFVAQALKIGAKKEHEGFHLWVKCMDGDPDAWRRMERYNRHDVKLLEALYLRLRPWMDRHPNHGAHDDIMACPKCGSENYQQRGWSVTQMLKYRRFQCQACGGWFRGNKSVSVDRRSERANNIAA